MRGLLSIFLVAAVIVAALPARAEEVVVFAAASLKNALDAAVTVWEEQGGETTVSYAGSSALARQIEQGAPAGIFISANPGWMDYLEERELIDPATRFDLLGNRLVLIAPSESDVTLEITPGFDLAGALGDGYLAMANTDAVPAGIYGRTALMSLGVWEIVQGRIAQARDVRAALTLVSRGEAPLGIVYRTDAAADANVRIVETFPEETHEPIIYPIALTKGAEGEAAHLLLDFLTSEDAAPYFEEEGFDVLDTDR